MASSLCVAEKLRPDCPDLSVNTVERRVVIPDVQLRLNYRP